MRSMNGTYTNRLPRDAESPVRQIGVSVGKSVGTAALQAVLVVTAARLVDAVFSAIADRRRSRRSRDTAAERPQRETVAA